MEKLVQSAHEASAKAEGAMLLSSPNFLRQVSPSSLLAAFPTRPASSGARPPESRLPVWPCALPPLLFRAAELSHVSSPVQENSHERARKVLGEMPAS